MTTSSPINKTIQSQLRMMEHFLSDMLDNVQEAHDYIEQGERNSAIGTLLASKESFEAIRSLYDTIITLHRNAALIERKD